MPTTFRPQQFSGMPYPNGPRRDNLGIGIPGTLQPQYFQQPAGMSGPGRDLRGPSLRDATRGLVPPPVGNDILDRMPNNSFGVAATPPGLVTRLAQLNAGGGQYTPFQQGMHEGDWMAKQRRAAGLGLAAAGPSAPVLQSSPPQTGGPPTAGTPQYANAVRYLAEHDLSRRNQSALGGLGVSNPAGAVADRVIAGGAPPQPTPTGFSNRQNYPTNVAPDVRDPSMPNVAPNYGQTVQQAQNDYVTTRLQATGDTQDRVREMLASQGQQMPAGPFGGPEMPQGNYATSGGNRLQISTMPGGAVRVVGSPRSSTLSPQQIATGRGRQMVRDEQVRNDRIIARARMNGLSPSQTPAVRRAYESAGIPIPGEPRRRAAAPASASTAAASAASPAAQPVAGPAPYAPPGTPGGLPLMTGPVTPGVRRTAQAPRIPTEYEIMNMIQAGYATPAEIAEARRVRNEALYGRNTGGTYPARSNVPFPMTGGF